MCYFAWADQRPVQGNISYTALQLNIAQEEPGKYILPRKVVSLIHTLIFRMLQKKLAIIYIIARACNFYLWYEFCILTIIENTIIFIVADIYK